MNGQGPGRREKMLNKWKMKRIAVATMAVAATNCTQPAPR